VPAPSPLEATALQCHPQGQGWGVGEIFRKIEAYFFAPNGRFASLTRAPFEGILHPDSG